MVSLTGSVGSQAQEILIAAKVKLLPLNISLIAHHIQVAAPQKGSASVGEL
jgi:hypothetical protein